jgi:hypothetical protein
LQSIFLGIFALNIVGHFILLRRSVSVMPCCEITTNVSPLPPPLSTSVIYGIKQSDMYIYLIFQIFMLAFEPVSDVFNHSMNEVRGFKKYHIDVFVFIVFVSHCCLVDRRYCFCLFLVGSITARVT